MASAPIWGQQNKDGEYRPFFKGGFQLPSTLSNRSFNRLISGVSDVDLSFHVPLKSDFSLGLAVNHSYMTFNDIAIPEKTDANFQYAAALLSATYTFKPNEKVNIDVALNGGYSLIFIKSQTCKDTGAERLNQSGLIVKPNVGIFIKSTDYLSFGLLVSYTYLNHEFGPDELCLTNFSGFDERDYSGNSTIFSVGFGFKSIIPQK